MENETLTVGSLVVALLALATLVAVVGVAAAQMLGDMP
jgi:hypothetical protein